MEVRTSMLTSSRMSVVTIRAEPGAAFRRRAGVHRLFHQSRFGATATVTRRRRKASAQNLWSIAVGDGLATCSVINETATAG
jgi:hypothetical protein